MKNALNLGIFTHAVPPPPSQNSPPGSYHQLPSRAKLLISQGSVFWIGGNYDMLYQN